jgi:hypothetical protein
MTTKNNANGKGLMAAIIDDTFQVDDANLDNSRTLLLAAFEPNRPTPFHG